MAGQRLGQHFLANRSYLRRLAEAACVTGESLVIEIGPGRGALTEFLLARAGRVIAIEVDSALVEHLRERFRGETRLTLVESDVLETDLAQWGPAAVAGNLPYYITSPILTKIFEAGPAVQRAILLVQREVAERLTAKPGSRDYGYLTVQTRFFTVPEMLFRVPPAAFSPPPKVESAAVRLTPRQETAGWDAAERAAFLEFAGLCFRQKRKTLRNNLVGRYGAAVETWPEARMRAEQLPLERLVELYRRLQAGA